MKYEKPILELMELEMVDVVCDSTPPGGLNPDVGDGGDW